MVYIGVQGQEERNAFTIIVWDQLFEPNEVSISVLETQTGVFYDIADNLVSRASINEYVNIYLVWSRSQAHSQFFDVSMQHWEWASMLSTIKFVVTDAKFSFGVKVFS